jgi:DNA-binding PadR family transcriptional regulator
MEHREILAGLVRLHILHHAAGDGIYGQWIIEELGRHGYRLSPGTLYPLLHGLEKKGYLRSRTKRVGHSSRRIYRATPFGRAALAEARGKVRELFREILEAPAGPPARASNR